MQVLRAKSGRKTKARFFTVRGVESLGNRDSTAQVHPYKLTNAMMDLASEKGAKVVKGTVQKVVHDEGGDNQVNLKIIFPFEAKIFSK
jgi:hypothetical protein